MQRNKTLFFIRWLLTILWSGLMITTAQAGSPLWTFEPLTPTTVAVPPGSSDTVQYRVTNQSSRAKNLVIQSTSGITQASACSLSAKGSPGSTCTLTLNINGSNLPEGGIQSGPRLCQAHQDGSANPNQCYQPARGNVLHIVKLSELVIGQAFQGGVVACLNGGLNNLIAATADRSVGIIWGISNGIDPGAGSNTDGASNTEAIVNYLASIGIATNSYAAGLCSNYEVDSQGNTPCQAGNTCYDDWFLPAGNNLTATGQLNCLFTHRMAIGGFSSAPYWSSTEVTGGVDAWDQNFLDGTQSQASENNLNRVRCVRFFTP